MTLTPQQLADALRDAGWSDSAVAELIEIHEEIERQRAEKREFIRVESKS